MTTKDLKTIAIVVELENGDAHQVLATRENKQILIDLPASMGGGLVLSGRIEPIKFKDASQLTK